MELETAGGVMTKHIEWQTFATQAASQTGFSERFFFLTGRVCHAGCATEGVLSVVSRCQRVAPILSSFFEHTVNEPSVTRLLLVFLRF